MLDQRSTECAKMQSGSQKEHIIARAAFLIITGFQFSRLTEMALLARMKELKS